VATLAPLAEKMHPEKYLTNIQGAFSSFPETGGRGGGFGRIIYIWT
jgi:hypothetical protein